MNIEKLKELLIKENFANIENLTSDSEMIRLSITAEMDAVNLYEIMAKKAKDKRVKNILNHIAEEEKHHIGEFIHLLNLIDNNQIKANKDGKKEAEEVIKGNY